jgi:hypothetical protein
VAGAARTPALGARHFIFLTHSVRASADCDRSACAGNFRFGSELSTPTNWRSSQKGGELPLAERAGTGREAGVRVVLQVEAVGEITRRRRTGR